MKYSPYYRVSQVNRHILFYRLIYFLPDGILVPMNQVKSSFPWGVEQRLKYIEAKLYWEGRVSRIDIIREFSLSPQQASSDLSAYNSLASQNLVYDPRIKVYLATHTIEPVFPVQSPLDYLSRLASEEMTARTTGWAPSVGFLPRPQRRLDAQVTRAILIAMRAGEALEVEYHSFGSVSEGLRWIEPHSLAHDGERWHVRAYCHKRNAFRDFNLGRVLRIGKRRVAEHSKDQDVDWQTAITVELIPHPKLEEQHRRIVEYDYGMESGKVSFNVQKAMLFYLLRRYGRESSTLSDDPFVFQVVLANEAQLRSLLETCKGAVVSKPL